MNNQEFFKITDILNSISKQLETQNLIQIIINQDKFNDFTKEDLERIKNTIKSNC